MNVQTAYNILSTATQPQVVGRLTRENYVEIQQALESFASLIKEVEDIKKKTPEITKN